MQFPDIPADDVFRVKTLHSLNILDTQPEERFDRLTRVAKNALKVSIALVSLVDTNRQWFKSKIGLDVCETPRNISFCGHAILGNDILCIPDARKDARFSDNPLVIGPPYIRFYAGCPLSIGTAKIGTLCLIDPQPRLFGPEDRQLLKDIAVMAEQELIAIHLATMDSLTGLLNRMGFEALAKRILPICNRLGKSAGLLFFDLNKFKAINDTFGHAEGDRALKTFADALLAVFREGDVVGRLGGDEFVVLLTETDESAIAAIISRLSAKLDGNKTDTGLGYNILFSVGQITYAPEIHKTVADFIAEADTAMYRKKRVPANY